MYAIVDIETTGGYASSNGITEIAIAIHDGVQIIDFYETLINPQRAIPPYVQSLTGISQAMVTVAPVFEEVAEKIYGLLHNKIFIAHNVNFDYSFVKHQLLQCGFTLDCKKLCTVRLSKLIIPGMPGYGLGKLCRSLEIENDARHRAGGDTLATVKLFEHLLKNDRENTIRSLLKGNAKEQHLPPHLPVEKVAKLPTKPGVYYFHDAKGKVVYVGKAKDLRKRVNSHFANNKPGRQKQEFLRNIHNITYQLCGSELMAFILECVEIKRLWPLYNRSLKGFEQAYGLYTFEDGRGYLRLAIEKKKKQLAPLYTFNYLLDGQQLLKTLIERFELCEKLCFIDKTGGPTLPDMHQLKPEDYNWRVNQALQHLQSELPSYAVVEEVIADNKGNTQGIILIEKGRFYGMGYVPANVTMTCMDDVKPLVTPYPENGYIRGLIHQYAEKFPNKKFSFIN